MTDTNTSRRVVRGLLACLLLSVATAAGCSVVFVALVMAAHALT